MKTRNLNRSKLSIIGFMPYILLKWEEAFFRKSTKISPTDWTKNGFLGSNKMYLCLGDAKEPFGFLNEQFDRENSHYFRRVCDWGPCTLGSLIRSWAWKLQVPFFQPIWHSHEKILRFYALWGIVNFHHDPFRSI